MATALLYPNDCLAPSWSHANPHFEPAIQKTESGLAPYDAEIGFSGGRRPRGSSGGCGTPGGLLPLSGHDPSTAVYSFALKNNANLRSPRGQIMSQRSVPYPQKRCRLPASTTEYRFTTAMPSPESPLRDGVLDNFLCCRGGLHIATPQSSQGAPAASVNTASSLHSQGCLSPKQANHHLGVSPQSDCSSSHSEPYIFISAPQISSDRGVVNGQPNRSLIKTSAQGDIEQAILAMYPSCQQPLYLGKPGSRKNSCNNLLTLPSPWSAAKTGKPVAVVDPKQPCKYAEDGQIGCYNDTMKSPPSDDTARSEGRAHGLFRRTYNRSNSDCCSWTSKSNDGHGRRDSTYDLFMAAVAERWAGPSFFNSPHPSALPVPSFASKLLRTCSSVASGAEDADFATKQLRRILHLDHLT